MRTLLVYSLIMIAAGMNGQAQSLEEKTDQLFKHVGTNDPGYIVGIIHHGKLIYSKGFGLANLDHRIPLSPTSAFYMASTSKQFAAACLLALVESGQVSLEDDIRNYLPEMPDYGTKVSLSHLLFHTSGIRDYTSLLLQSGSDKDWESKFGNDDIYKLLCKQQSLNFQPGERYAYSSSGYILLTKIIEKVSGKSLRQFADSALFKPLNMKNTFFSDNYRETILNRVDSYRQSGSEYERILKTFDVYGDGGLISTLEDFAKWDEAFYSDKLGIVDFGKKMSGQGILNDGHAINYAWGLQKHTYRGVPMIEHGGFMINFDSEIMRFPDQKFTVIVMSNCWQGGATGSMNLCHQIADMYLSSSFENAPVKSPRPKKLKKKITFNPETFKGNYWNVHGNYYNVIGESDGDLFFDNTNGSKPKLVPIVKNTFSVEGTELQISFEGNNMTLTNPAANNRIQYFEKFDATPPGSIEDLVHYAGAYHSRELETTYRLLIDDKKLFLKINDKPSFQLYPATGNVVWNSATMVWIGFAEIKFTVELTGEVTGLLIGDNRVKGVVFKKQIE